MTGKAQGQSKASIAWLANSSSDNNKTHRPGREISWRVSEQWDEPPEITQHPRSELEDPAGLPSQGPSDCGVSDG